MTTDTVGISLVPETAMLSFAEALPSRAALTSRRLHMELRVTSGDDVRLPTQERGLQNRTVKDAYWTAEFVNADTYSEYATEQGAIGFLRYRAARDKYPDATWPESCHISAALKPENFAMVLSALQTGRLPEKIHIMVKGMTSGSEPDGSGVIWDVDALSDVPIVEVSFTIPLVAAVQDLLPFDNLPTTTRDIRSLEKSIVGALLSSRADVRIGSVLLVLFVALVVLYFNH